MMNLKNLAAFTFAIVGAPVVGQVQQNTNVIAPGVTWIHEAISEGPLNFNVLKVELADPAVTLEAESGRDSLYQGETVLDSVKREAAGTNTRIVGAVNADFWAGTPRPYTPVGLVVADGMIYNMPSTKKSAFALSKDELPYIGLVTLNVSLGSGKNQLSIKKINSGSAAPKDIVLFTPPFGEEVGPIAGTRFLLKLGSTEFLPNQSVEVAVSTVDATTSTPLPRDALILQIPPELKRSTSWLKNGMSLKLGAVMPEVKGVVTSVCGGGPVVVMNGKVAVAEEQTGKTFRETKHPRTAVGVSQDLKTAFLVTVDGRQPRLSVGTTLDELGAYMVKLGCWMAMNLDGGGSTTMVVNDAVVNKPSDLQGPRTVANSLLVVTTPTEPKAPAGISEGGIVLLQESPQNLALPAKNY